MKKLLIVSDSFLPRWDGVARFLSDIIPELSNEYKITVICPRFEGKEPRFQNTKIIRMPLIDMLQFGDIKFSWFNHKEIKKEVKKADIVWTHTIGPLGISAVRAAHKMNKHLIAYVHSIEWELTPNSVAYSKNFVYHSVKRMARRIYSKFDLIIVPTKEVARILQFNKINKPKGIVYLGVNPEKFKPTENKDKAKEKIGIHPDTIVVGFSGRLGREKDLPTLLRAFLRLKTKYPKLHLLIVGSGTPEQKKKLEKKNVILAGSQDDVVPYLQAMDIYVLPSLTETSSLSTMEAMSCGLPVIATKVGFVKYYINEKINGLLFPKRNSLILQMKLESLVKDKRLREKLGKEARKTIIEKHQWNTTVERVKSILEGY